MWIDDDRVLLERLEIFDIEDYLVGEQDTFLMKDNYEESVRVNVLIFKAGSENKEDWIYGFERYCTVCNKWRPAKLFTHILTSKTCMSCSPPNISQRAVQKIRLEELKQQVRKNRRDVNRPIHERVCSTCMRILPAERFTSNYDTCITGTCKVCAKEKRLLAEAKTKKLPMKARQEKTKKLSSGNLCAGCGIIKPWDQFYGLNSSATGFHTYCKDCCKAKNKQYRQVKE